MGTDSIQQNPYAIIVFLLFMAVTITITWWASKRSGSRSEFYAAGAEITPFQNGVAIAGDFLSAATLLGVTSLIYFSGVDAFILIAAVLTAWPIIMIVVAERLRNLGQYTFIDVIGFRFKRPSLKIWVSVVSMFVIILYLVAQLLAAGKLIELIFGLDYKLAVTGASALVIIYVLFGGMLATTWVQFIKAVLLIAGGVILLSLILIELDFDVILLFEEAADKHPLGLDIFKPGGWLDNPLAIVSVALTGLIGFIGMPHLLMRFFTVSDARSARKSSVIALIIIALFHVVIVLAGFAAMIFILDNPSYHTPDGQLIGGRNMVVLHLADFLGGKLFLGFLSAVTFATILAVVSGLTIAAAATAAHDFYKTIFGHTDISEKKELMISKATVLGVGIIGALLAIAFERANVVFITNLSSAIAASVNAPLLILSIYWARMTSAGALSGAIVGLSLSIIFIVLGPDVWVGIFGFERPVYPYVWPTLISMPISIFTIILISKFDNSEFAKQERKAFKKQFIISELGLFTAKPQSH